MGRSKLCVLLALILVFCLFPTTAFAETVEEDVLVDLSVLTSYPAAPQIDAPAAILIEAKTGTILYAKNANTAYYPASITKVMTALLVLENCSLDETVTFSYRATHDLEEGSSSIARTEGEELSVENCLYAMLIASANEVAQALAEHVGGTIEDFATMMTARAIELGCTNTHFTNPSGLNNTEHYTTAHDMALIMRAAIQLSDFLTIDSTTTYCIPATNKNENPLWISMKHKLLLSGDYYYEYAVAGKTGYTQLAGYTLVTYATKDDMDLICVTLGCDTADSRYAATTALFDWGFENFTMYDIASSDTSLTGNLQEDDTFLGSNLLSLSLSEDSWVILPNSLSFNSLSRDFSWGGEEEATNTLATVTYSYEGITVGQTTMTINENDDGNSLYSSAQSFHQLSTGFSLPIPFWLFLLLLLVIASFGFFLFSSRRQKRRKRRRKPTLRRSSRRKGSRQRRSFRYRNRR